MRSLSLPSNTPRIYKPPHSTPQQNLKNTLVRRSALLATTPILARFLILHGRLRRLFPNQLSRKLLEPWRKYAGAAGLISECIT